MLLTSLVVVVLLRRDSSWTSVVRHDYFLSELSDFVRSIQALH
jgi:hypothetical protein